MKVGFKKALSLFLAFVMVLGMLPMSSIVANAELYEDAACTAHPDKTHFKYSDCAEDWSFVGLGIVYGGKLYYPDSRYEDNVIRQDQLAEGVTLPYEGDDSWLYSDNDIFYVCSGTHGTSSTDPLADVKAAVGDYTGECIFILNLSDSTIPAAGKANVLSYLGTHTEFTISTRLGDTCWNLYTAGYASSISVYMSETHEAKDGVCDVCGATLGGSDPFADLIDAIGENECVSAENEKGEYYSGAEAVLAMLAEAELEEGTLEYDGEVWSFIDSDGDGCWVIIYGAEHEIDNVGCANCGFPCDHSKSTSTDVCSICGTPLGGSSYTCANGHAIDESMLPPAADFVTDEACYIYCEDVDCLYYDGFWYSHTAGVECPFCGTTKAAELTIADIVTAVQDTTYKCVHLTDSNEEFYINNRSDAVSQLESADGSEIESIESIPSEDYTVFYITFSNEDFWTLFVELEHDFSNSFCSKCHMTCDHSESTSTAACSICGSPMESYSSNPMVFTATGAVTISLAKVPTDAAYKYTTDSGATWKDFPAMLKDGESIGVSMALPASSAYTTNNYLQFKSEGAGTLTVSGNAMALLPNGATMPDYAFFNVFCGMKNLVDASGLVLSATTLSKYCYNNMFKDCSELTAGPSLPATNMAEGCYDHMFRTCGKLETAPALPATNLAPACYKGMFRQCASLTEAPALPATIMVDRCYNQIFQQCTGLTEAPELPATVMADECYKLMFYGCTGLTEAPELPATQLARECYNAMFCGCTGLNIGTTETTNAWKIPAQTAATDWNSMMFDDCTNVDFGDGSKTPALNVTYYQKVNSTSNIGEVTTSLIDNYQTEYALNEHSMVTVDEAVAIKVEMEDMPDVDGGTYKFNELTSAGAEGDELASGTLTINGAGYAQFTALTFYEGKTYQATVTLYKGSDVVGTYKYIIIGWAEAAEPDVSASLMMVEDEITLNEHSAVSVEEADAVKVYVENVPGTATAAYRLNELTAGEGNTWTEGTKLAEGEINFNGGIGYGQFSEGALTFEEGKKYQVTVTLIDGSNELGSYKYVINGTAIVSTALTEEQVIAAADAAGVMGFYDAANSRTLAQFNGNFPNFAAFIDFYKEAWYEFDNSEAPEYVWSDGEGSIILTMDEDGEPVSLVFDFYGQIYTFLPVSTALTEEQVIAAADDAGVVDFYDNENFVTFAEVEGFDNFADYIDYYKTNAGADYKFDNSKAPEYVWSDGKGSIILNMGSDGKPASLVYDYFGSTNTFLPVSTALTEEQVIAAADAAGVMDFYNEALSMTYGECQDNDSFEFVVEWFKDTKDLVFDDSAAPTYTWTNGEDSIFVTMDAEGNVVSVTDDLLFASKVTFLPVSTALTIEDVLDNIKGYYEDENANGWNISDEGVISYIDYSDNSTTKGNVKVVSAINGTVVLTVGESYSLQTLTFTLDAQGVAQSLNVNYYSNDYSYTRATRHVHSWATEWSHDDYFHWYACTAEGGTEGCRDKNSASKKEGHNLVNGVCTVCAAAIPARGTLVGECTNTRHDEHYAIVKVEDGVAYMDCWVDGAYVCRLEVTLSNLQDSVSLEAVVPGAVIGVHNEEFFGMVFPQVDSMCEELTYELISNSDAPEWLADMIAKLEAVAEDFVSEELAAMPEIEDASLSAFFGEDGAAEFFDRIFKPEYSVNDNVYTIAGTSESPDNATVTITLDADGNITQVVVTMMGEDLTFEHAEVPAPVVYTSLLNGEEDEYALNEHSAVSVEEATAIKVVMEDGPGVRTGTYKVNELTLVEGEEESTWTEGSELASGELSINTIGYAEFENWMIFEQGKRYQVTVTLSNDAEVVGTYKYAINGSAEAEQVETTVTTSLLNGEEDEFALNEHSAVSVEDAAAIKVVMENLAGVRTGTYKVNELTLTDNNWTEGSELASGELSINTIGYAEFENALTFEQGKRYQVTVTLSDDAKVVGTYKYAFNGSTPHAHSFAAAWTNDETGHWHVCTGVFCDITDYSATTETGAAYAVHTYGTDGAARYTCTVCAKVNETLKTAAEAADLTAAKEAAIQALNTAAGTNPSEAVKKIVSDYTAKINAATTTTSVTSEKEAGLAAIAAQLKAEGEAEAAAKLLADAKDAAKKAIADEKGNDTSANVVKAAEDAVKAIDAAKTVEEVNAAKTAGIEAMRAAKAANELAAAKEAAIQALNTAAGTKPSEAVKKIVSDYTAKINAATTTTSVTSEKEAGLAAIAAQLKAEGDAEAAAKLLADAKDAAKKAIADEKGTDTSANVVKAAEDAVKAIDAAKTVEEVNAAKTAGIEAIKAAKAANELTAAKEAAINALKEAAGETPSDAVKVIVAEYTAKVNNAADTDSVTSEKEAGLAAIAAQLKAEGDAEAAAKLLADAKDEAKKAIADEKGNDTSANVVKAAEDAVKAIDAAATVEEVTAAKNAGIEAIQVAKRDNLKPDASVKDETQVSAPEAGKVENITSQIKTNDMSASVSGNLERAMNVTAEEKAAGVWVWMELDEKSAQEADAKDVAKIEKALNGKTIGAYMDIAVFKQVVGGAKEKVSVLGEPVTIALVVPQSLRKEGRTFSILYVHGDNDPVEVKADSYNNATGVLTFRADKFSTYTLIYKDSTNPKTGDAKTTAMWAGVMLVGMLAVTAGAMLPNKKRRSGKFSK